MTYNNRSSFNVIHPIIMVMYVICRRPYLSSGTRVAGSDEDTRIRLMNMNESVRDAHVH